MARRAVGATDPNVERYLVDDHGQRTHAVLPIANYEAMLRAMQRRSGTAPSQGGGLAELLYGADEVWFFVEERKGTNARAILRFPSMIVLRGSRTSREVSDGAHDSIRQFRDWLLDTGVAEPDERGSIRFVRDFAFANASEAASVLSGASKNGYREWTNNGRSMNDHGFTRTEIPPHFLHHRPFPRLPHGR